MSIPQILADISKARAVISNANTVELHRVHEAIEELLAERDKLKADLSKATSRAEDVRTEGLTIGAGNLIIGNFSLPRVITADELKEGDKYAVIWTHEDGNELVDVARFTPGYNQPGILQGGGGWIMKKDIIAIVLLEHAPESEPTPELPSEPANNPCKFSLIRDEDETGVSGTGKVAEGIIYSDGHVSLRWIVGEHQSTVTYDSIEAVRAIHGHGGKTRVVVDDA